MSIFLRHWVAALLLLSGLGHGALAAPAPTDSTRYFRFEPTFLTNYQKFQGGTLGYIRMGMQLQVADDNAYQLLTQYEPLLRDAILNRLFALQFNEFSDLEQRELLRQQLLEMLNSLLQEKVGSKPIKDALITQFLWQ